MDEREVAQLVGGDAAPGAVATIPAETGGNPFFVKQLVRHLRGARRRGRRGRGRADGVRDVIAARVGRLSEHAGRVLGVAARSAATSTSSCSSASPAYLRTTCSTCSTRRSAARC